MAAYRRVYDSRHLQAECQELGSAPEPYAGDAENARHEIAGHENAAPCCRGGKCEGRGRKRVRGREVEGRGST